MMQLQMSMMTPIPSLTAMILLVSKLEFADTSTCETGMHTGLIVAAVLKAPPPNAQLTLLNAALSS
jgi:hypothetical protein